MVIFAAVVLSSVMSWSAEPVGAAQPASPPASQPASQAASPPASQAAATGDSSPLVVEAVVNATPTEVWKVWSTPEGFKKLGAAKCDMDFRVGGVIRSHYDPNGELGDDGTIHNQIIAYEPERMIAFRIFQPPKGFPFPTAWKSTWSVATMTDLGDGRTHVRLAGMGYDATDESQKMKGFFRAGNSYVMKLLQSKFDAAAPGPTGPAHPQGSLDSIEKQAVVRLTRAEAWALFATNEGWKKMIAEGADIDLRPGGKFEVYFDLSKPKGERGDEDCMVLSYVRDAMMSFTWSAPPRFPFARSKRAWVIVHVDELSPASSRIRLSHQGFAELAAEYPDHRAEFEQARAYFDKAWEKVLAGAVAAGRPSSSAASTQ